MRSKNIFFILVMILVVSSIVSAIEFRTVYNPFTGKLDYYRGSNFSGENITAGEFFGNLSWVYLHNYPVACPAGTAITQLEDSVICTSFGNLLNNTPDTKRFFNGTTFFGGLLTVYDDLLVQDDINLTGTGAQLYVQNGNAFFPSITSIDDQDTGIYWSSSDNELFFVSGADVLFELNPEIISIIQTTNISFVNPATNAFNNIIITNILDRNASETIYGDYNFINTLTLNSVTLGDWLEVNKSGLANNTA
ncbi:hypothetical protein LCGC14_2429040, partial [marine sediment metagenome]